ncbi:MAG: hypothetical protein WBG37_05650 [Desulfobacterales bacterium]
MKFSSAIRPSTIEFSRLRRQVIRNGALGLLGLLVPFPNWAWGAAPESMYGALLDLTRLEPMEKPLVMFRDFAPHEDQEIKDRILWELSRQPDLSDKIRAKLGAQGPLSISFESLDIRLLYVPETRKPYAEAYQRYCRDVIDFTLARTGTRNPFNHLVVPQSDSPQISQEGTTVFLVHQLAKAYKARCKFSSEQGRSVTFKLTGAQFSSHLGAVDLSIESPADGEYRLTRKNYTIWQNHTANLYTLLSIPVEETLHYAMGPFTDEIIGRELQLGGLTRVHEVQTLAGDWMAVEEALVGGLVYGILREYVDSRGFNLPMAEVLADFKRKEALAQYKYRQTGLELVSRLGYQEAVELYKTNPADFKGRLQMEQG